MSPGDCWMDFKLVLNLDRPHWPYSPLQLFLSLIICTPQIRQELKYTNWSSSNLDNLPHYCASSILDGVLLRKELLYLLMMPLFEFSFSPHHIAVVQNSLQITTTWSMQLRATPRVHSENTFREDSPDMRSVHLLKWGCLGPKTKNLGTGGVRYW